MFNSLMQKAQNLTESVKEKAQNLTESVKEKAQNTIKQIDVKSTLGYVSDVIMTPISGASEEINKYWQDYWYKQYEEKINTESKKFQQLCRDQLEVLKKIKEKIATNMGAKHPSFTDITYQIQKLEFLMDKNYFKKMTLVDFLNYKETFRENLTQDEFDFYKEDLSKQDLGIATEYLTKYTPNVNK